MPYRKIVLKPGVNLEQSTSLNQTQLAVSNLIRFYGQLVQKLGGWLQLTAQTFIGTCRGLHGWADNFGNAYLAAGTEQRLEVLIGGTLYDITPVVATDNPTVAFSTTATSSSVEIDDPGYTPDQGDWINLTTQVSVGGIILFGYYSVATSIDGTHYTINAMSPATGTVTVGGAVPVFTTLIGLSTVSVLLDNHGYSVGSIFPLDVSTMVGGITLSGNYSVTSVTDANNFVITATSTAIANASAAMNGGNAQIEYLLPTGRSVETPLYGYGSGLYGAGLYGGGGSGQSVAPLRQWSLDHFGQDLIASPSNLGIYYWQPPDPVPAILMPNAPLYSMAVFVMPQVEIVVSLGAELAGVQQPLLSRWCDQGDFTDWTASATNQAGSFTYSSGSKLVGGLALGLLALVWTDEGLWGQSYLGFPLVFGFNKIASGCGLIAQRAAGGYATSVMWLSIRGFFGFSTGGGVSPMECPVWDFLFANIDTTQLQQVHCAPNSLFNELAWHFPIAPSSPLYNPLAPMGYVKANYADAQNLIWDYGLSSQYQRTAWVNVSPAGNPIGADLNGLLQQHEIGYDANGAGMRWMWQTGDFDLMEGKDYIFSDFLIPDVVTLGTSPTFTPTIQMTNYPYEQPFEAVVPMIGPSNYFITYSARGRQMAFGLVGSDLGTFNRLGAFRVRYAPDGEH